MIHAIPSAIAQTRFELGDNPWPIIGGIFVVLFALSLLLAFISTRCW
jgi:hypothetical protein